MAHGMYPNDNWYKLGLLLAGNYNNNWDDRGAKKGLALHEAMMNNPDPTDEEMKTAFDAERAALMQNTKPPGLTGMIPKEYRINFDGGENASKSFTSMIPGYTPNVSSSVSNDLGGKGLLGSMFPVQKQPEQPQGVFSEFLQNQSDRANEVRVATTPDEGGVFERASQAAKKRYNETFSAEEHLANLNKELIKKGLSPESIEAVMKQATADASTKQGKLYEQKSDALVTEYNNRMGAGDYQGANALLPNLIKYNQPLTQMLLGSSPNYRDFYASAENKKIRDENFARNKEIRDEDFERELIKGDINYDRQISLAQLKRVLANAEYEDRVKIQERYGLNTGGKGSTHQGYGNYSRVQIDQANKVLNHAAKYFQDNFGDMSKYPFQKELEEANRIQSYILSGGQQPQKREPAIPSELQGFISKLTPNSTSKDILTAYLKDEQIQGFLANNPQHIEWFENQTGLVFPRKNIPKNNNPNNNFAAQSNNGQDVQLYGGD